MQHLCDSYADCKIMFWCINSKWNIYKKLVSSRNATLGYIPKKNENIHLHKTCIHMFIAALFIMPKNGNNPDFHKLVNTWLKCGIIT